MWWGNWPCASFILWQHWTKYVWQALRHLWNKGKLAMYSSAVESPAVAGADWGGLADVVIMSSDRRDHSISHNHLSSRTRGSRDTFHLPSTWECGTFESKALPTRTCNSAKVERTIWPKVGPASGRKTEGFVGAVYQGARCALFIPMGKGKTRSCALFFEQSSLNQ